ncbi:Sec1-like protein [Kickxella alabastrina]|uniref:Sec1-like protein n=1 Tax=Kickxella alabastrina TaxID=61397 RepID=UPI00221F1511|nr:Sec1-like protein [Kickxella alabastrina]KAI7821112.1 Sec1-like protein [Kickxella alabastrina]
MPSNSNQPEPDLLQLRAILRDELISILETIRGAKSLVLDKDLAGALSSIVDFAVLKDHGVEKIYLLEPGPLPATTPSTGIIYFSMPHVRKMKWIAEHIRRNSSSPHDYSLHLVPRRTLLCERVLEEEGVLGDITVSEYRMDFIPLEDDLLSLELPNTFKDLYLDGDFSSIQYVARAVMRLQTLYGFFPRIVGKGDFARILADSLTRMRLEMVAASNASAKNTAVLAMSSVFDSVVIIDRAVDLVTPLLTQLTYEGLISEVYGITNGFVTLPQQQQQQQQQNTPNTASASQSPPSPPSPPPPPSARGSSSAPRRKRLALNSQDDAIYRETRSMNFASVGSLLSKMSRQLQDTYESRHKAKTVQEIRSFVGKLGSLQAEHQSLKAHVSLAETIVKRTQSDDFNSLLDIEQTLVAGSDLSKEQMAYVEKLFALADPLASAPGVPGNDDVTSSTQMLPPPAQAPHSLYKCLRILCLYSLCRSGQSGFKQKVYDAWYEELVSAFGHQQTVTLDNLSNAGLFHPTPSSGLLNTVAPSTRPRNSVHTNSMAFLRKSLNLVVSDDISYVYSGYAPLSVRLLQCLVRDPAVYTAPTSNRYASLLLRPLNMSLQTASNRPASLQTSDDGTQNTGGVKSGWTGWEDVLNELPGETVDLTAAGAADAMIRRLGEKAPATLVVFLGGCTHTEIAALRLLSLQHNHRYVAATTEIINGNSFLDPLIQKTLPIK